MRVIQKFVADDDTEFRTQADCEQYEEQCRQIRNAIDPLGKRPVNAEFLNGRGYVQHSNNAFHAALAKTLDATETVIGKHNWIDQTRGNASIHKSWVGRLVGDSGHKALNDAWYRFQCIDNSGREWGQPYFANHPEEGEQTALRGEQP